MVAQYLISVRHVWDLNKVRKFLKTNYRDPILFALESRDQFSVFFLKSFFWDQFSVFFSFWEPPPHTHKETNYHKEWLCISSFLQTTPIVHQSTGSFCNSWSTSCIVAVLWNPLFVLVTPPPTPLLLLKNWGYIFGCPFICTVFIFYRWNGLKLKQYFCLECSLIRMNDFVCM